MHSSRPDSGLASLVIIARLHTIAADPQQIRHQSGHSTQHPFNEEDIVLAGRALGLKCKASTLTCSRLIKTPLPCLAFDREGKHFVLARADHERVLIHDPLVDRPSLISIEELQSRWTGRVILFTSRASIASELAHFDFSWFIPAVVKYRKLLLEVLGVSVVLQIFALISPLCFQVVMDKVLVHQSYTTLDVVCIGLLVSSIFDVLLTGLRSYVFSHTTNRIDVELGAKLFKHLLTLPLPYFSVRRVGDTVARVRELENIRNFLTGQAMTALIDVVFSVIFLGVMCIYSVSLTIIVALSLPCYMIWSASIVPSLRTRLKEKFARGADNQSFLVEAVSNIETVKAMAMEPQFTRKWNTQLASYVTAGFRVSSLANIGQQGVQMIGKIVTVLTLWLGSHLVISGKMSVGALVAFNMMAGRVATPVLRLAQLWQDFQQIGISMQRLGDILNTPTEIPQSRQALPQVKGEIEFEDVKFRYAPDSPQILKGISFTLQSGEVIGVVGRSGAGKSTLTKLLQRLYLPEAGRIRIDGIDLALADPAWLRRQIGVVLQENRLFNCSIRENIAMTDPGLPLDRVIHAAKLAGAHEFISELAEGYDTVVGEHGTGLSGGQRQRVAIARALISDPRILIFDEATSALDYESERIIQQNMKAICAGRTVIIIAHRLSAVRDAHRIIAMDKGLIVEVGSHDALLQQKGYYARLIELQRV
jgi:ATP-binding cassette, subfamily B, bacterial HlyB/CyaB